MLFWTRLIGATAAAFGACGVALAAAGAHILGEPNVTVAANFLLFHAAALIGFSALAAASTRATGVLISASLIAVGATLFSGELAIHALAKVSAFTIAAPIGGSTTIIGWLVGILAVPFALRRRSDLS